MKLKKFFGHLNTVNKHRFLVFKYSVKAGIPFRGLVHDLSKYSLLEFLEGVKYYNGNFSPISTCKKVNGYSKAWLHHKGRNKHHYEYWIDYSTRLPGGMQPVPMPDKYIAEMLMDRIAACKIYNGKAYTDRSPLQYYESGKDPAPLHAYTKEVLEKLLKMLAEKGEKETFQYVKTELLSKNRTK